MSVEDRDGGLAAVYRGEVVMHAVPATVDDAVPGPVSFDDARVAASAYEGFLNHAFPGCFVCGPDRAEGDGLRIFPGRLGDGAAAPWTPDTSTADQQGIVRPEIVWAALDCPTGWATYYASEGGLALLGRLAVRLIEPVLTGERYVAAAWPTGIDGRKQHATSAIISSDRTVCAVARATWIELRT